MYEQSTVGINDASGSQTVTATLPNDVKAGSILFAFVYGETYAISAVSDTQGNTYEKLGGRDFTCGIYVCKNAAAGATTLSASSNSGGSTTARRILVAEYSGVDATTPVDIDSVSGNVATVTTKSFSPPANTILITAAGSWQSYRSISSGDVGTVRVQSAGPGHQIGDTVFTSADTGITRTVTVSGTSLNRTTGVLSVLYPLATPPAGGNFFAVF